MWARYIVLNKNGTANELEAQSRNYNPLSIFNDMKCVDTLFQHFILSQVTSLTDCKVTWPTWKPTSGYGQLI